MRIGVDNSLESVYAYVALTYLLMAVFVAAEKIHAVIEMNRSQAIKANGLIEGFQYAVQVVHNIVSAVEDMAGVQANAQPLVLFYQVYDGAKFFKSTSNFASLACHRF